MKNTVENAFYHGWDFQCTGRLVEVLIQNGYKTTDHMWRLFETRINGLGILDGKVCYYSFFEPSKRIMSVLSRYNSAIIDNFKYITRGTS